MNRTQRKKRVRSRPRTWRIAIPAEADDRRVAFVFLTWGGGALNERAIIQWFLMRVGHWSATRGGTIGVQDGEQYVLTCRWFTAERLVVALALAELAMDWSGALGSGEFDVTTPGIPAATLEQARRDVLAYRDAAVVH